MVGDLRLRWRQRRARHRRTTPIRRPAMQRGWERQWGSRAGGAFGSLITQCNAYGVRTTLSETRLSKQFRDVPFSPIRYANSPKQRAPVTAKFNSRRSICSVGRRRIGRRRAAQSRWTRTMPMDLTRRVSRTGQDRMSHRRLFSAGRRCPLPDPVPHLLHRPSCGLDRGLHAGCRATSSPAGSRETPASRGDGRGVKFRQCPVGESPGAASLAEAISGSVDVSEVQSVSSSPEPLSPPAPYRRSPAARVAPCLASNATRLRHLPVIPHHRLWAAVRGSARDRFAGRRRTLPSKPRTNNGCPWDGVTHYHGTFVHPRKPRCGVVRRGSVRRGETTLEIPP